MSQCGERVRIGDEANTRAITERLRSRCAAKGEVSREPAEIVDTALHKVTSIAKAEKPGDGE